MKRPRHDVWGAMSDNEQEGIVYIFYYVYRNARVEIVYINIFFAGMECPSLRNDHRSVEGVI